MKQRASASHAASFGAYGKLPCSLEFLRHACYEGCARRYRSWIDEGNDLLSQQGTRPSLQGSLRLLYLPSELPQEMLLGVCVASGDATQTRKFPFTIFYHMPRAADPLSAVSTCWQALVDELPALRESVDSDEFYRLAQQATAPLPPEQSSSTDTPSAALWIRALYPEDSEHHWGRALWYLKNLLPAHEAERQDPLLTGVRLPLAEEWPAVDQLRAWLGLLGSIHSNYSATPSILLGENGRTAHLFWRDLSREDWPLLVTDTTVDSRLCDLCDDQQRLPTQGFEPFLASISKQSFASDLRIDQLSQLEVRL